MDHQRHQSSSWGCSPDWDGFSGDDSESDNGYDSESTSGYSESESENEYVSNNANSPRLAHAHNFDDSDYDSSDNESNHGPTSRHSSFQRPIAYIPPRRNPAPGPPRFYHTYSNRSIESLSSEESDESDASSAYRRGCQARSPRTLNFSAPYATNSDPYLSSCEHPYPDQRFRDSGRLAVDSGSRSAHRRAYSDGNSRRSSGHGQLRDERVRSSQRERRGGDVDRSRRRERHREPQYSSDNDDEGAAQGGLVRFLRSGIRALGSGLGG